MFNLEKTNRNNKDLWGSQFFDRDFDRLFDMFGGQEFHAPACEVVDEEKQYAISVDVPGMREEDINLEVKDGHLYITGERKYENKTEKKNVLRTERRYGKFQRIFTLPQDVNEDSIDAKFENGVLEITIPKTEKAQPRKISIGKGKTLDGQAQLKN